MAIAHILGFPRIGKHREIKKALEAYWASEIDEDTLNQVGKKLRQENWELQRNAGLDFITVGDFSWYDQVLDTALMLGVIPSRFNKEEGSPLSLDTLFRMARGACRTSKEVMALEMTKWFDTNYHYIVPELEANPQLHLANLKLFDEIAEATALDLKVKPTIIGPLTFLWLAKSKLPHYNKLTLLDDLVAVYIQILHRLKEANIEWVQVEEPILGLDLPQVWQDAFESVYTRLKSIDVKILLTTYFSGLAENTHFVCQLPIDGIHLDLVRCPKQLTGMIDKLPNYKILSAGIINGRNVWRNDLRKSYEFLQEAKAHLKERLWIAPSCSLLHVPVDLEEEKTLDLEIKSWLAFAVQKLEEVVILTKALNGESMEAYFAQSDQCVQSRLNSSKVHHPDVCARVNAISEDMSQRQSPYVKRNEKQKKLLKLPLFPTTTIGSFPQTQEIRHIRHAFKTKEMSLDAYIENIQHHIKEAIFFQEALDLDVLVHGEAERNDMVEYFGEQLEGFALTQNGWVQSYGSRYVKPPIIYGDVFRSHPVTITWSEYAQSLTKRPVKGMLTGPVTILSWSFVRDDQTRSKTAMQIALALRDEIKDLEAAGIRIIQIDEPAFREGLPLRHAQWAAYLEWAVKAFRLASCGVQETTQIHTHMCYSEFNDVIKWIAALDADVITIETSRSHMELLCAFEDFDYPNQIGPGVYDVHSPHIPMVEEMVELLTKAMSVIPVERLWVNPDCGLKTRNWEQTKQALSNMVIAAKKMRAQFVQDKETSAS